MSNLHPLHATLSSVICSMAFQFRDVWKWIVVQLFSLSLRLLLAQICRRKFIHLPVLKRWARAFSCQSFQKAALRLALQRYFLSRFSSKYYANQFMAFRFSRGIMNQFVQYVSFPLHFISFLTVFGFALLPYLDFILITCYQRDSTNKARVPTSANTVYMKLICTNKARVPTSANTVYMKLICTNKALQCPPLLILCIYDIDMHGQKVETHAWTPPE